MRILGIDPGIERTGFSILEMQKGKLVLLDCGLIFTEKKYSLSERLTTLANDLKSVIRQWKPAGAGIEQIFFSKNVKTAITVAHARGVILEVLEEHGVPVMEFNPGQVKIAVSGDSKADKKQVKKMIEYLVGVRLKNDDTADAIACAVCALNSSTHEALKKNSNR